MAASQIRNKLTKKGLKITPQRIAILEAIFKLNNHPTAEKITEYIRKTYPNIATATVYKVLNILIENGIIKQVKTEKDRMRYDAITETHHHLYCTASDEIKDYYNDEINTLLSDYFKKHKIPDFEIEEIQLQLTGKFKK